MCNPLRIGEVIINLDNVIEIDLQDRVKIVTLGESGSEHGERWPLSYYFEGEEAEALRYLFKQIGGPDVLRNYALHKKAERYRLKQW